MLCLKFKFTQAITFLQKSVPLEGNHWLNEMVVGKHADETFHPCSFLRLDNQRIYPPAPQNELSLQLHFLQSVKVLLIHCH